eukprot:scaffold3450_cov323-Prasinococcus_capsulatus_cf.AAC.1
MNGQAAVPPVRAAATRARGRRGSISRQRNAHRVRTLRASRARVTRAARQRAGASTTVVVIMNQDARWPAWARPGTNGDRPRRARGGAGARSLARSPRHDHVGWWVRGP